MRRPDYLTTLYIDFDAFFAHVEKQLNPALHDKAVGIIPLPSNHSSLIACCYQAKAMGIKRGMKQVEAREVCPDMVFIPARHDVYVKVHHDIIKEVNRFAPVIKVWSIDEVECKMPRLSTEEAVRLAEDMRDGLARAVGPIVTPSIGLSSNQLLAKIAAEMQKPRGLIVLHPNDLPGRLLDVPLRDVPGIASGVEYRLNRAGIFRMEDLWRIAPKQARAIWHNVEGERMWSQLHGYVTEKPPTKRAMFGHGRVLSGPWRQPDKALDCLVLLGAKAARRLRYDEFMATRLTVSIKDERKQRVSHEVQFPPARDDFTLLRALREGFAICRQKTRATRYTSASVMLHGLKKMGHYSEDLFEQIDAPEQKAGYEKISDIMDSLNRRYGGTVVHLGTRHEPPGGYAGAKIAFGRVPSFEDFMKVG
ncbi:Y-family DNA polymerase [Litorimonas sp. RW-G-Af-16]|uniref:Y-family DNA polymerase n=1 Tax=Litorimonas sp. RW-G-Af-16 TaxID=3241168 RepID=UPI00390CAC6A